MVDVLLLLSTGVASFGNVMAQRAATPTRRRSTTRRRPFLLPALLLVACRSTLADFDDAAEEERQRASGLRSLERDGKGKVPDINVRCHCLAARAHPHAYP